jgi:hypothetical protein
MNIIMNNVIMNNVIMINVIIIQTLVFVNKNEWILLRKFSKD